MDAMVAVTTTLTGLAVGILAGKLVLQGLLRVTFGRPRP